MSKKSTSTKSTTKPTTTKTPRTSKSAEGAAKTERLRKAVIAEIGNRLESDSPGTQDHEVPTAKESANTAAVEAIAKGKKAKAAKTAAPAKPAKPAAPTKTAAPAKAAKPAKRDSKSPRTSGLDLAATVLATAKEPLNAKTIAERVVAGGWKTSGKTPHATLYAAMIREIAVKGSDARFRKTDRGLFTATGKGA